MSFVLRVLAAIAFVVAPSTPTSVSRSRVARRINGSVVGSRGRPRRAGAVSSPPRSGRLAPGFAEARAITLRDLSNRTSRLVIEPPRTA